MNIKEGDLVSIKQDFIDKKNRYEYDSRDIWNVKEVGAVLQKEVRRVLGENVNKNISRNMKIKATKYRNDYRVWLDYAGDYRNENIE